MANVVTYEFQNSRIEFELANGNVMVNATQMAKVFGKQVEAFIRNEQTKSFMEACLKSENSRFLNVQSEEDLIQSKQKTGTFMHRILALKFAAWLNSDFELWVYSTIDRLLFSDYHQLRDNIKKTAERKNEIDTLLDELRTDERFIKLEKLELEDRHATLQRSKISRNQLSLFRQITNPKNLLDN